MSTLMVQPSSHRTSLKFLLRLELLLRKHTLMIFPCRMWSLPAIIVGGLLGGSDWPVGDTLRQARVLLSPDISQSSALQRDANDRCPQLKGPHQSWKYQSWTQQLQDGDLSNDKRFSCAPWTLAWFLVIRNLLQAFKNDHDPIPGTPTATFLCKEPFVELSRSKSSEALKQKTASYKKRKRSASWTRKYEEQPQKNRQDWWNHSISSSVTRRGSIFLSSVQQTFTAYKTFQRWQEVLPHQNTPTKV